MLPEYCFVTRSAEYLNVGVGVHFDFANIPWTASIYARIASRAREATISQHSTTSLPVGSNQEYGVWSTTPEYSVLRYSPVLLPHESRSVYSNGVTRICEIEIGKGGLAE